MFVLNRRDHMQLSLNQDQLHVYGDVGEGRLLSNIQVFGDKREAPHQRALHLE